MSVFTVLFILSLICFILYLIPGRTKRIFGAAAWIFLGLLFVISSLLYIQEAEFVYPAAAVIALPLLYITIRGCLTPERITKRMPPARHQKYFSQRSAFIVTDIAAAAIIIYTAAAMIPQIADLLISLQVKTTAGMLSLLNYPAVISAWDTIESGGYFVQITVSCTPVTGAAIMTALAVCTAANMRERFFGILFTLATLSLLNLMRLVFVVIAYSDQWFPYLADSFSGGYSGFESFYWSHNVISRIFFSFAGIIITGGGLLYLIPRTEDYYRRILFFYYKGAVYIKARLFGENPDENC